MFLWWRVLLLLLFMASLCCAQEEKLLLNIENALTRALAYNRTLINSAQNLLNTEFNVELAKSAFDIKFTPSSRAGITGGGAGGEGFSIGGGIDFSKRSIYGTHVTLGPSVVKTKQHYASELRYVVSQPLLRGFGVEYQLSGVRAAEFANRTARRNLFTSQVQLAVRTLVALYDIIKAQKAVELSQESYQRIFSYHQAAKLKAQIGLSDALDVYRAEIELRQAQDTLTSSQERLQEVEDTLRDMLALPLNIPFEVQVPLVYTPSYVSVDQAIQLALENRIEIEQGIDQWREAYRLAGIAKKDLLPELNLVFNYNNTGRHEIFSDTWRGRRESTWGVGFTTSTNYDPLGDQFAYDQSQCAIQTAERDLEQVKSTLILEIKRAVRQLERCYKRILLQEEQMHSSQGELHLAKLKFDRGMANNFDVIQAEKNYRSAEQTYWNALIDHIIGEYQLLQAMGCLTDKPCVQ